MLKINVDTSELVEFVGALDKAQKLTTPLIAAGLNEMGDAVSSLIAQSLSKQSGLPLEQVRGVMDIRRATRGNMRYEIKVDPDLMEGKPMQDGGRERTDFLGKTNPSMMVIVVSKQDELVCMDCEELAAAGPMPMSVAMQHVPKHPHCRCIIMPYVQRGKRMPVTMTTLSGTSASKRMGSQSLDVDLTLRQMAQKILDSTSNSIKIELS
jgi:hypothetical protein